MLPIALHFFCFFVEALLRSVELKSVENFDDAADRIMCRMHVTGTSYAWNAVATHEQKVALARDMECVIAHTRAQFVPDMLKSSREGGAEEDDEEDEHTVPMPEQENIVSPGLPIRTGQASLKDLVNLVLSRHEQHDDSRLLTLFSVLCAAFYASLPTIVRLATGAYLQSNGAAFFLVTSATLLTNFIICLVALDALAKSVQQLKMRVAIASTFTQLNSKTAASSLGLFHLELQTIENLWGWLTLRSYLLRRGKRPQARVEIILSASFAFLVPLALMLAIDFFFSKSPLSVFIVSSFFFCFVVASYLLLCVWNGVKIQAIYRDQDVLLAEQLAIHCNSAPV